MITMTLTVDDDKSRQYWQKRKARDRHRLLAMDPVKAQELARVIPRDCTVDTANIIEKLESELTGMIKDGVVSIPA
jgi:hypothetical protein